VKLLMQPEDGIKPILLALKKAKKNIRILIFRFDRIEIEKALVDAVARGVNVQALIAHFRPVIEARIDDYHRAKPLPGEPLIVEAAD